MNNTIEKIPTVCGMCGPDTGCGIYALVKDGVFVGIEGMEESPINQGRLCPKAYGSTQWVYSPDRIMNPLKRIGEKGEGKFAEISWEEAIETIADKLLAQKKEFGPESLAILSPARRSYSSLLYRFLMAHGSPNYGHSGICAMQRAFAFSYTIGTGFPLADYENADLVIIWAKQPIYSLSSKGGIRRFITAKERGVKYIAIKPSVEADVAKADVWVPIRPGTDAALALAMTRVIINEDLYDKKFVSDWCYGFDGYKDHVQKYTPEWAETITGVPARQIEEVARMYATASSAAIDLGNGVEHAPSSSDAIRAIGILMAITGNLDRKGGNLIKIGSASPMPNPLEMRNRQTPELREKLVAPEFPPQFQPFFEGFSSAYYRIIESVVTGEPYQIKSIIAPGTQPLVSTRGSKTTEKALRELDFFVSIDVTRTAETPFADIVMPVASSYETDYPFERIETWVGARRKVIEPRGDYKSMHEFWLDLAVKMGYGRDFWEGDVNRCMDYLLEPYDITFDDLKNLPFGISFTPQPPEYEKYATAFSAKSLLFSGDAFLPQNKVAIRNTTFEKAGFSAYPRWVEPPESPTATPELLTDYPLTFTDYHTSKVYNASWLRNVPILREIDPDPTLHIHPNTATKRGIEDGDWVFVESPHGRIRLKAKHYPGIRPDTVMALHGWWQGCEELGFQDFNICDDGANTNNIYATQGTGVYDPLVTAMTSQTLVEVRKA